MPSSFATQSSPAAARLVKGILALSVLAMSSSCALYGFDEDGGFDLPIAVTQSITVPIDLNALPGSGQTSPTAQQIPLQLDALPVDLISTSSELQKNRDKIERLEFKRIVITPLENTLTSELPQLQLSVGPLASGGDNTVLVATIPVIPAGSGETVPADIDEAGTDGAQPYLTALQFDFVPTALLDIAEGQTIPSGSVDLEVEFTIQATIDPTK